MTANDTTLVVYRENRYCPFTSRLPQHYVRRIEAISGVASAVPVRILVSNCRASLDVVTFRGVGTEQFLTQYVPRFELLDGSAEEWRRRGDGALVGESLARRRSIKLGDRLTAAGITVYVAGIFRSDEPQDQNVAYTHLAFVQEAAERGGTGGIVTQFNVKVTDPSLLEPVATAIDEEFAHDQDPTFTSPEKAFVARAATDILQIVSFASWLGWGALAAVFALVANAIVLAVQDRIRDHAVLQTLGYSGNLVGAADRDRGGGARRAGRRTRRRGGVRRRQPRPVQHDDGRPQRRRSPPIRPCSWPGWRSRCCWAWPRASCRPGEASRREIAACFRAV